MPDDATHQLEERIAHLESALGDVSDMVARQDAEIARLTRRIEMLMSREAEREFASARRRTAAARDARDLATC